MSAPRAPLPEGQVCIHCGAPAGRPVFGEGWWCRNCGKWQDMMDCPTCGTNVQVWRIKEPKS